MGKRRRSNHQQQRQQDDEARRSMGAANAIDLSSSSKSSSIDNGSSVFGRRTNDDDRLPSSSSVLISAQHEQDQFPMWYHWHLQQQHYGEIECVDSSSSSSLAQHARTIRSTNRRIQNKRRQYGEHLERQYAFGDNNLFASCPKKDDLSPEVIYRAPVQNMKKYINCTFLGAHTDKVLAVDSTCTIDVVSTVVNDISRQTGNEHGTSSSTHKFNLLHYLANEFNLKVESKSRSVYLQSLGRTGSDSTSTTVAVGMENDCLCFVELDRISEHHNDKNNGYQHVPPSYINPDNNRGGRVPMSPTPPTISVLSTRREPKRVFYRDRHDKDLILQEQFRKQLSRYHHFTSNDPCIHTNYNIVEYLTRIDDPSSRMSDNIEFVPHQSVNQQSRWNVIETRPSGHLSSSLMYVAHIDSASDAFWVQAVDGRKSEHSLRGTKDCDSSNSRNRPNLLVDLSSSNCPPNREEHITAISFVSDLCLATSHISCPSYGMTKPREIFDKGLPYAGNGMKSCVKLWDIRMFRHGRKQQPLDTVSVGTNSGNSDDTTTGEEPVTLPSFPDADAYGSKPEENIDASITARGFLKFKSIGSSRGDAQSEGVGTTGNCDHVVTQLTTVKSRFDSGNSGSTRTGSLLITTVPRSRRTEIQHHRLDLGRMKVTQKVYQDTDVDPVFAVSERNDGILACYSDQNKVAFLGNVVNLYNLQDVPSEASSDSALINQLTVKTQVELLGPLSCLSLNSDGTAVLAGSEDGDLYLWRSKHDRRRRLAHFLKR